MRADRPVLTGLSLVCFANLLLEVLVTRLFSATMFYHFTFLAVALALFGIAASGVYVFLNEQRLGGEVHAAMARNARWFAVTTGLALVYAMANPMDIIFISGTSKVPAFANRQFWQLVLLVLVTAMPFFFAGVVVSLALTFFRENVSQVYFFDLAGAAVAAMAVGPLLGLVGGPTAVLLAAAVALFAADMFERRRWRWLWPSLALVVAAINIVTPIVEVPSVKGVKSEKTRFEKWNMFSRVTVDDGNTIKIDASAATQIENSAKLASYPHRVEVSALAHAMFEPPADQALVIGPGGGRDVLHALSAGAGHVTGVEVNPIIAKDIMGHRYLEASGRLYRDPRVTIEVDDGRSFVRRSSVAYDLVQASLVDTWAATAAGAFALTENTLYTVEAFADYFGHLTSRGAVTMTRWHTGEGGESARLLILAAAALEARGVAPREVRKHIFYAISPKNGLGTLVAKKTPIDDGERARLEAACAGNGWKVLVSPTTAGTSKLERYLDAGAHSALVASAAEDLSPPSDDRPFFFYFKKVGDLFRPTGQMSDPSLWVVISLGSVLVLSAIFIVMPLVVRMASGGGVTRGEAPGLAKLAIGYFALVGFAFMAVEIALLQRFTLFLGHPSYSLVVILFAVLLSTALGARFAGRWKPEQLGRIMAMGGGALAIIATVYGVVLGDLLRAWIGLALPLRIAITVVLVAPCGVAMGTMIPVAIRAMTAAKSALVPWAWGVNGATSVIGTVSATVIAIYGGFTATFVVGAIAYAAAGGIGWLLSRYADGDATGSPAR